ncbi:MAG: hypothetical protein HZC28_15940 [Spirochaetes bacterium]|nr:hypothetical protein [Spirochaetota bacterium]
MRAICIICAAIVLSFSLSPASYYLSEDFGVADGSVMLSNIVINTNWANGTNGWTNGMWYGREGVIIPELAGAPLLTNTNMYMSQQIMSNGKLEISGCPSPADGGSSRDGRWKGKWVYHTNRYSATVYHPFGWEVVRELSFLDISDVVTKPGSGGAADHVPTPKSDARKHATLGLAMFYDNPAASLEKTYNFNRAYEGGSFANYFEWSEHAGFLSTWFRRFEVFESSEVSIEDDFLDARRPDGAVSNVSNAMYWDYIITNAATWTPLTNTNYWNSNAIGFRVVHDGSDLNLFVNPNPYGKRPAYPNEWMFVHKRPVTWNSNFQIMIGHGQRGFGGYLGHEWAYGTFDNLLIRSAADLSQIYFQPAAIANAGTFQTVAMVISNVILQTTNAGVNYIRIIKPASFDLTNDLLVGIRVKTHYSNTASEITLSNYFYSNDSFPDDGQCAIMTNSWTNAAGSNEIRLLLGNQITNMTQADWEYVKVEMVIRSTNPTFFNDAWTAYVTADQFNAMPSSKLSNYSTCGWQKCTGSGLVDATISPALAYTAVTPSVMQQVTELNSVTFRLATYEDVPRASIKKIAILVPDEFKNCKLSNFNSAYLGYGISNHMSTNTTIAGLTNATSSRLIIVDYTSSILPANGAREAITFDVVGRLKANIDGNDPNLVWKCWVDGVDVSSNSYLTLTNADYQSQKITIEPDTNVTSWDVSVDDVRNRSSGQAVKNAETEVLLAKVRRPGYTNAQTITNIVITNLLTNQAFYGFFNIYTNGSDDTLAGSIPVSLSNYISNLNAFIRVTNVITNLSASVVNPTRLIFTYTPLVFDTFATNKFRIADMKVNGPNSATNTVEPVQNSNLFQNATTNIKLEDNTLIADVEPMLTNTIKQGVKGKSVAFKINLRSLDQDATFTVNNLVFTIASTNLINQSDLSIAVYRDNGLMPGTYDANDTIISGSDGVFANGKKISTFAETVTIDKNNTYLYAVITPSDKAQISAQFTIGFPKTSQTGFTPAGASISNDGASQETILCTIFPDVQFNSNKAAVGNTLLRPGSGEKVALYLDDSASGDYTQYKAYIYDIAGAKVQEISFPSYVAYWDGKTIAGQIVRSGMYIAIIKGPGNYLRKTKLMVVK